MLYRATYYRNGLARGVTFAADSNDDADDFVRFWESFAKVEVLTVKCLRRREEQFDLEGIPR